MLLRCVGLCACIFVEAPGYYSQPRQKLAKIDFFSITGLVRGFPKLDLTTYPSLISRARPDVHARRHVEINKVDGQVR